MVIVHEIVALLFQHLLDGGTCSGKSLKDGVHVVTLLHGNDAHVILLIQPDEEVLGLVVEDSTRVRPVPATPRGQQQRGVRLLEEIATLAEVLLLLLRHTGRHQLVGPGAMQRQILSLQFSSEPQETLHNHPLQLPPLLERARRWEPEPAHRPPGPTPGGQSVLALRVDLGVQQVVRVHVRRVLGICRVSTVPGGDNRVK
mmetsp:Transcript_52179/g.114535  ORF Transcript_52179/g.114535 Transcript_52179/m.114535 type:complete len:200 (-) Transcript_52179:592-1191(-)